MTCDLHNISLIPYTFIIRLFKKFAVCEKLSLTISLPLPLPSSAPLGFCNHSLIWLKYVTWTPLLCKQGCPSPRRSLHLLSSFSPSQHGRILAQYAPCLAPASGADQLTHGKAASTVILASTHPTTLISQLTRQTEIQDDESQIPRWWGIFFPGIQKRKAIISSDVVPWYYSVLLERERAPGAEKLIPTNLVMPSQVPEGNFRRKSRTCYLSFQKQCSNQVLQWVPIGGSVNSKMLYSFPPVRSGSTIGQRWGEY